MHIEDYGGDRRQLLELFVLADDSPAQIANYVGLGDVLIARDGCAIVGHLQMIETDDAAVFELKSMAVIEARQRQGIGRRLVEAAIARCRQRSGRKLIVSTAAAATGNMRFYQRQGFRMCRIVRDAFGPATGYATGTLVDGIPLRDQVFLELDLRC
jgi:GNAT superfamily N-acetyltransferase